VAVQLLEREDELGVLRAALEGAIRGHGRGIALAGESGVGKSTLIEAVCENVNGARVLRGHCDR
jgi:predicted ATPase